MKHTPDSLARVAANPHAHKHPYGSHTRGPTHMMHKGRGTPPAPHVQGTNQPPPRQGAAYPMPKSPSNYGNQY